MKKKTSVIWKISKEDLQYLFDTCNTKCEIFSKLGFGSQNQGGNNNTLNARVQHDNIDLTKYKQNLSSFLSKNNKHKKQKITEDMILVEDCKHIRNTVKRFILANNILAYICSDCGNDGTHNGKKLILQLEHINGVSNDNRRENLCFLCPNCHSQTSTFCGKNVKAAKQLNFSSIEHKVKKAKIYETEDQRIKRFESYKKFVISKEDLETLIQTLPLTKIGERFGVSDNAIKKRCKTLGIDLSLRKFKRTRT